MDMIQISSGDINIKAELLNTPTASAIAAKLPIESSVQTWGDEVYFRIPVDAELEDDARDVVEAGDLAFWVEGKCIAIGFGPTPISVADEIRLAARTNIWARAIDDVKQLRQIKVGDLIKVEHCQ